MKIGEAARLVGADVHVLRHWDDLEIVVPSRTVGGHRDYTDEHVQRMRILRACQAAGMSLAEIRLVLQRDRTGRDAALADRLDAIRDQRARLADAESFLVHVLECRHDLVTRCDECSSYAASPRC